MAPTWLKMSRALRRLANMLVWNCPYNTIWTQSSWKLCRALWRLANTLFRNGPFSTINYGTHLVDVAQGFVEVGEHTL